MLDKIAYVALATLAPISELRGGIPLGIALGLDPLATFAIAVALNPLIFFPTYFLAEFFYSKLLSKIEFFHKYITNLRKHAHPYVKKYGTVSLIFFVGIGAYTASLVAWLFGLEWKRAFAAITFGVLLVGIIVLAISLGIFKLAF